MRIIAPEAAPVFNMDGLRVTGLASPRRGAVDCAAWRIEVAPGTPPTMHWVTREEIFIAISGRALVHFGGETHALDAGGAAIIPANAEFALSNPNADVFEAVAVLPVGGQAGMGDAPPFTPPWAE